MLWDDLEYYSGRASCEAKAAASSSAAEIAHVHRILAGHYEEQVRKLRAQLDDQHHRGPAPGIFIFEKGCKRPVPPALCVT